MNIKSLFVAVAVLACTLASAQESNRDADGKVQYGPYQTNKFFDNWYIGVGGGLNLGLNEFFASIAKGNVAGGTEAGWGLDAEFVIGKQITPCFGVRFGYQGLSTAINQTLGDSFRNFKVWTPSQVKAQKLKGVINFGYVHADGLWNLSNQFGGYKEKRVVEIVPYLHAGVIWNSYPEDFSSTASVAGGLGLMIPFRVGTRVHIIPDFRGILSNDKLYQGLTTNDGRAGMFSATLGVTVGLGKTNFTRVSTTVASAASALASAEAAKSALQAEKDRLANALASANADKEALAKQVMALKNAPAQVKEVPGKIELSKNMVVYFEIGKATISKKELEHLDFYVRNVLEKEKTVCFTISGSADSATGTKSCNQKLSRKRADYIYELLTKKYGMTEDRFSVKALGGVKSASCPELDRAVIIEVQ